MDSVLSLDGEMVLVTSLVPPDPGIMALSHSSPGGHRGTHICYRVQKDLFDSGDYRMVLAQSIFTALLLG